MTTSNIGQKGKLQFEAGDRVGAKLSSGETELGKVLRVLDADDKAIVHLDSGRKIRIKTYRLIPDVDLQEIEEDEPESIEGGLFREPEEFEAEGFTQYDVQWDDRVINFRLKNEIGLFYGWVRRVSTKSFAVDLHCQYNQKEYNCETIFYTEDPRDDLDSLNADLCAAVNKWFYYRCRGDYETIDTLEQRSAKPTIYINTIETIDKLLIGLRDYRDTAIKSGGRYTYMFTGDNPNDPSMRIVLDLSTQAKALDGRVPSLFTGVLLDQVTDPNISFTKKGKRQGRGPTPPSNVFQGNINELIEKLKTTKDKAQQRKLRAILRRMGHKGGARTKKSK
jgi:hypothetical protein